MILGKGHSFEVDWWALGILLFEMVTGVLPFTGSSPQIVHQKITLGRFTIPNTVDPVISSFICGLLEANPSKRLGCKDGCSNARNHEWLAEIDFHALITKEFSSPWVPEIQGEFDTSYFNSYPESIELSPLPSIHTNQDPFEGF